MTLLRTYSQAFVLLLILLAGAPMGRSTARPARPVATETVTERSTHMSAYLTHALSLRRNQRAAVRQCTQQYLQQLDSLAAAPEMLAAHVDGALAARPARVQVEERYTENMARILTAGQFNAFSWLQKSQSAARP
ncbi:hypothetical protein [Hymenobacter sp. AT01-02]|uniref:hypothetical protein n=1 Tax=Hymenobacter sp. AT01-02 TaxID=1571877 RepID=UPI0005F24358|nr:hypothetical protein [Hymenobacter sp. AT01-02]